MRIAPNEGHNRFAVLLDIIVGHLLFQWSPYVEVGAQMDINGENDFENILCDHGFQQQIEICSRLPDDKNVGKHERLIDSFVVYFDLKSRTIQLTVLKNQVHHPNANISLDFLSEGIPFYKEDVAKDLNKFYIGSFTFLNFTVPFSAELRETFFGSAYLFETNISLSCPNWLWQQYNKPKPCYQCEVICSRYNTNERNSNVLTRGLPTSHHMPVNPHWFLDSIEQTKATQSRPRRDVKRQSKPTSCSLHLVADRFFYRYVGDGNVLKTVNHMLSMINRLDAIFRATDFDGDKWSDNIGFIVKKVTVLNRNESIYPMNDNMHMTSREYLEHFSLVNFDSFCLSIAFTFRDFGGTAGSAYPAYSDGSLRGGICQKPLRIESKSKSENKNQAISFNTVVVTFLLKGERRTPLEVLLTLAHEVGHSFGASHDEDVGCPGNKEHGDFIMSQTTNSGYMANNQKFSACSLRSMLPVIKKKGGCLIRGAIVPQCGNGLPEEGEECDCGWSRNCEQIDPCCTPADDISSSDRPCTIRRSQQKLCSPLVSPCCSKACGYITEAIACESFNECTQSETSRCNGSSPHCPQDYVAKDTPCNAGLQVCVQGQCSLSICEFHNLTQCICYREGKCSVCCQKNETCAPLEDLISPGYPFPSQSGIDQCMGKNCFSLSPPCFGPVTNALVNNNNRQSEIFYQLNLHVRQHWLHYSLLGIMTLIIITILSVSYTTDDSQHMKSLRYGKMLAVFAQGQHMGQVYDKILQDIDEYYTEAIKRTETSTMPLGFIEAIARLKALFPEVSLDYLMKIAKLSASEEIAVKILLIQGFKMRTFSR